ncbi:EAL domain-containing protein, partial [Rhodanobacter lindaniclasticus]
TVAIIEMARRLDKLVVAEGVETPEQAAFLRQAGCAELQGFLFAAALPADEFERLLGPPD